MSYEVRYKGVLVATMTNAAGDACISATSGEWCLYNVMGDPACPCFVISKGFKVTPPAGGMVVYLWEGTKLVKKSD